MTSLVKAIQERLANVVATLKHSPGGFTVPFRDECAAAIRAADLSDLEPKGAEGATPSDTPITDACGIRQLERPFEYRWMGFQDCARQLERELAALTTRLEVAEGEREALRKNHHYVFKQCAAHIGQPISILWTDGTYMHSHIEEVCPNCKQAALKERE